MPRGHEHDSIYSLRIYARFSDQFFLKFSLKKIAIGKKTDRCAVFGWNNDRIFSREIYREVFFLPKNRAYILSECPLGIAYVKVKAHTAGAYFQFP